MHTSSPLRWGILGPGRIAERFCQSLLQVDGCVLSAVASRDAARAADFAARFGAARTHTRYEALAADPAVDIVYISTPHIFHAAQIRLCLEAGKHVLCEKPITISAAELAPLIELAAARHCFLMEGLWSRFIPAWQRMRAWIDAGRIGEPRMASAHFGFRSEWNPGGRLLNPDLAGGAMWDVGIYTLAFATSVLGTDLVQAQASAHRGETGVDEQSGLLLSFRGGRLATLTCAVRTTLPQGAWVAGTEGRIELEEPFWKPRRVRWINGGEQEELEFPFEETGFQFEIEHVRDCLSQGLRQSPVVPLPESLLWQRIMDKALAPLPS